jgi:SET domain-containing protein
VGGVLTPAFLVAWYSCERVDIKQLVERYGPKNGGSVHVYTLDDCVGDKKWADAALDRCIAAMINDARGTGLKPNCEFAGEQGAIGVYACAEIEKGDECLLDYGKGYWKSYAGAAIDYKTTTTSG